MTGVRARKAPRASMAQTVPRHRVVGMLGLAEARRLMRHPLVLAGVALTIVIMVLWFQGDLVVLHRASIQLPILLLPLYAMLLVAAHANTSRTARDETAEVVDPAPTSATERILAHLLATSAGGALAGALIGGALVVLWATGAIWGPVPAQLVVGPIVAIVAGVIGVLAGVWTPARPAVLLWLAPLAFAQLYTSEAIDARTRILAPVFETAAVQLSEFGYRPTAAHLVYVAGIGLAVAGLALARRRRDILVMGVTVVGVVAAVAGGVVQARGPSDAWFERTTSVVATPEPHSGCAQEAGIEVCTLPAYTAWTPRVGAIVAEVGARLPDEWRAPIRRVQQAVDPRVRWYAIRPWDRDRASAMESPHPYGSDDPPSALTFPVSWGQHGVGLAELQLGLRAATTALEIPAEEIVRERVSSEDAAAARDAGLTSQPGDVRVVRRPCDTAGQARTVVALWLAGQGSPNAGSALGGAAAAIRGNEHSVGTREGMATFRLFDPTDTYFPLQVASGEIPPVSNEAVLLAAQMVERPSEVLERRLMGDLGRWRDPATSVAELVAALDLAAVPTIDEQIAQAGMAGEMSMEGSDREPCRVTSS